MITFAALVVVMQALGAAPGRFWRSNDKRPLSGQELPLGQVASISPLRTLSPFDRLKSPFLVLIGKSVVEGQVQSMRVVQFVIVAAASGSLGFAGTPKSVAMQVTSLVNAAVAPSTETQSLSSLERLGMRGVPYIVAHLDDFRLLPIKALSLRNNSPRAFEETRHYAPETVHDALAAILNQLTGKSFEIVYNGATVEVRRRNVKEWRDWCIKTFPNKATACEHGV